MDEVSRPSDYERLDADPRLIGALALGIAIFLLLTPLILWGLYPESPRLGGIPGTPPAPPSPRLQVHPKADLDALRAEERDRLTTYGWVDRGHQVTHVPIGRAMDLLAERGLPDWPRPSPPQPANR
jgi:hypothetical protein